VGIFTHVFLKIGATWLLGYLGLLLE
jgi:hypothetical protein